ncbi:DUF3179 family protein [Halalkaliarchaeum sp. AArc-CO]|uniref:DUF3179 domain-containing protein n=1 Tax=unclassified Halalkaliarchaeum TaxID=2678344 RepID=UPI00217DEBA9|nr:MULTISPECIES: DUF3179 domain-containing protein [unclassified Halalkaliarchaeum]MDR5671646.1 DUF3179 domain-containing protein [Halalkaliarchaeum sp. AArc-GB]UWG51147.1 DUF3179 family protein [Halalkaliarchaeum sp. AArc-CO]
MVTRYRSRRSILAAVAGTSLLAGCTSTARPATGGTGPGSDRAEGTGNDVPADFEPVYVGDDPPGGEPSKAPPFGDRVLPLPLSPAELRSRATDGGPPKDGIPSIDDPEFLEVGDAETPDDDAIVLGMVGDDEAKAYPRRVLVQHEIVNDTLDGVPVAVTYCPLTGTALGFERGDTEFGVSGMLINNNLIMYDRELERWWPQIPAVSIPGPWHDTPGGATLREFDVVRTRWGAWRDRHPDTVVLSEATGFARNYGRDPYGARGYYQNDNTIFGNLHESDRYHSKRWVYGIRAEEGATAFLADSVRESGVVHGAVGDVPHVAVYDPGLDTAIVYRNPDGETFEFDGGAVRDENRDEYPPNDLPLQPALSFDAFWFGWFAYYPQTAVYE